MNDWTEDLTMIANTYTSDDYGNQVLGTAETTVQASKKQIQMNEFYAARRAGIQPAIELIVHTFEYDGQQEFLYNGKRYSLIRTYERNDDEVELYLEQKGSDANGGSTN